MTALEKINSLTWARLKEVLKDLNSSSGDLRSFKVYTALLTQTGTSAPTAIVLENTFNTPIIWTRFSTGVYFGTLSSIFDVNKIMFSIGGFYNSGYGYVSSIEVIDGQTVRIITEEEISVIGGIDLLSKDDSMFNLPIEIRVYN